MVSDRGGKFGYVVKSRQDVYLALVAKGLSQKEAASIANKGRTKAGRKSIARSAAASRKRGGKRK